MAAGTASPGLAAGAAVNTAVYVLGIKVLLRGLTWVGVLSSWFLGTLTYAAFGAGGYVIVCLYFIIGSLVRWGAKGGEGADACLTPSSLALRLLCLFTSPPVTFPYVAVLACEWLLRVAALHKKRCWLIRSCLPALWAQQRTGDQGEAGAEAAGGHCGGALRPALPGAHGCGVACFYS